MSEDLIFAALNVTEQAAIACYDLIGRGQEKAADNAAVQSMRKTIGAMNISGRIVIGEGERDEAPMLFIGEELGLGGVAMDIAVDPLEGTTLCAKALPNSIAVMAMTEKGKLLHAPDVYMEKIAIGGGYPEGIIDIDNSVMTNIANLAKAKKVDVKDVGVMILERPRHEELIAKARETGARVHLITDGDIAAVIATTDPVKTGIDIYMGSGGAPEGVLASAALGTIGGQMMGKLLFKNDEQIIRAKSMGVVDINKKYHHYEMASGNIIFAATGVTSGNMLSGVKVKNNIITTQTMILSSKLKKKMIITSNHYK
jgi:fructose-1,6-bisphosphatase II / sedoheptulose-1,7-bisphosphatase